MCTVTTGGRYTVIAYPCLLKTLEKRYRLKKKDIEESKTRLITPARKVKIKNAPFKSVQARKNNYNQLVALSGSAVSLKSPKPPESALRQAGYSTAKANADKTLNAVSSIRRMAANSINPKFEPAIYIV